MGIKPSKLKGRAPILHVKYKKPEVTVEDLVEYFNKRKVPVALPKRDTPLGNLWKRCTEANYTGMHRQIFDAACNECPSMKAAYQAKEAKRSKKKESGCKKKQKKK